ncbi:MAG: S8 family serine peptidase [Chloroflexota bacterium]|nr:S8 family serine peptidase [Chloroflexota bacterium]
MRCQPLPLRTRARLLTAVMTVVLVATVSPASAVAVGARHPHAEDRVIVGFDADASRRQRRRAAASVSAAAVDGVSVIARDVVLMDLAPGQSVPRAIRKIGAQPGVVFVEPDYLVQAAASPDDPWYGSGDHWGMYGDATSPHVNRFGSGAGEAWAKGHVGVSSVFVGIIDEGVQISHPDLADNVWRNPWESANGVDDDGNGYVDDIAGWDFYHDDASVYDSITDDHGTHVAGIIGARGGNGTGVAGVNWRVTLIPAKFLGPGGGYVSDAVQAIDYITDLKTRHGLDIVATNNSWTGGGYSQALVDAIDRAGDAGILFVAAAGNDGRDIDAAPAYPASHECVTHADGTPRGWDCLVSVANIEPDGDRHPDSDWGAVGVDLGAPGTDIISTQPDDGYAFLSGTSMAAPHVSGAAAACASLDPSLSARQVRGLILGTGAPTGSLAGRTVTGDRVDIGALVTACVPPPTPPPARVILIDDLDEEFRRFGWGWSEGLSGYAGHHFWLPAREKTKAHYGAWKPVLERAGWYAIAVRIPVAHATSRRAAYRVKTITGWVTRRRNQKKHQGTWVSLGIHHLTTTPIVQLSDKTGEDVSLGRRLAFDAARFVPVAGPPHDS